jgi:hypothetical protein
MSKQRIDKTVYTEAVITQVGEVVNSKTVYKTQTEPDFVKLYIDCVFTVKGVKKGFNPIFLAFLEYMSYADTNSKYGGQVIFVNKAMKMNIAETVGLSIVSVNNAITDFVKKGIFKRIDVGTYQINPNIVGRGEWKDIKNIRATFDFGAKDIVADIVRNEETAIDEAVDAIATESNLRIAKIENKKQLLLNDEQKE